MRFFNQLHRTVSLFLCLAIAASALTFAGFSAYAEENAAIPQSSWQMTVPQIRVTTAEGNGTTLQKADGYQNANITILGTDGSVLQDAVSFKVRGNTTAMTWVTKKAYTFKFEKKKDVLGMGKGKKWALIANAFDPTLLRNYTAFAIADELGLEYTSNRRFVELWVDDSFRGCYLLMEPVQEGKDRVNIDIESNDGKKDFLLEYEAMRVEDDVTYFTTDGLRFIASEPEEPTEEQLEYIKSTTHDIINTMQTGTRNEIEAKVDTDSFAKFYLLNEYLKTFDFDMSSVFFYYQNGKLYAGPPWDYDLSAGNGNPDYSARGVATHEPEGTFANARNLYKYLCKNAWFNEKVKEIYREHYGFFANISTDGGLLDSVREQYGDIIARNYHEAGWNAAKWWINIQLQPQKSYDGNYTFLKDWFSARNAWMTEYYEVYPTVLLGDADGNGTVNINDATAVSRAVASFPFDDIEQLRLRGDVNLDGRLTVDDVTLLQQYLADFTVEYAIGTMTKRGV